MGIDNCRDDDLPLARVPTPRWDFVEHGPVDRGPVLQGTLDALRTIENLNLKGEYVVKKWHSSSRLALTLWWAFCAQLLATALALVWAH